MVDTAGSARAGWAGVGRGRGGTDGEGSEPGRLGTAWFGAGASGDGVVRSRGDWGRRGSEPGRLGTGVPGVSWRPGQAVAATRRPGREALGGIPDPRFQG